MAINGLGTTNNWNLSLNPARKINVNDDDVKTIVSGPVSSGSDSGSPLVPIDTNTLLANRNIKLQSTPKDYVNEEEFLEDFTQGKYKDGQTGTIDGKKYIIKNNTLYYIKENA